jgi:NDP-sugar pyrophosphorylase family protein
LNAHLQMIEQAGELSGLPRRGRYLWTADDIPKHVHLHPPAIVGPGLRAAPGTAIGPAAFLGSNVRLMRNAAVERAVVWDGASVADKVKDCIVSQQNVVSAAVTP